MSDLGLIRKSQEMLNRGLHAIEPLIQSDKQLNKFVAKRLDEERDKLINAVFAKTYSGLTEDDIQHFCSNIIQRMYLLKKFFPPKLAHTIGVVVTHPNASPIDIQVVALLFRI